MPETTTAPAKPAPGPEVNLTDLPRQSSGGGPSDRLKASALAHLGIKSDPKPEPEPAATPEPPAKPAAAAPEKPAGTPEPAKPASDTPKGKEGPKELREALERATKKADEAVASALTTSKEKAEALQKQADAEARLAKAQERIDKEYEPARQRLTEVEKKLQEREEDLRKQNYMATPDFHDKFVKPIADTEADISALLSESLATVDGQATQATREHFDYVMGARTLNEAGERAEQIFGKHVGPQIVNLRAKLQSQMRTKQKAAEEAGLASLEHQKQQQLSWAQQQEARRTFFNSEVSKILESDPDLKAPDGDTELAEAINEGKQFSERMLNRPDGMTDQQYLAEAARGYSNNIKVKAQAVQIKKMSAEIQSLKKNLADYQRSEPTVETRNGGGGERTTEEPVSPKAGLLARATEAAKKYNSPTGR